MVFNRYTGRPEREAICGGCLLSLAYGNCIGRLLQVLIGSSIAFSRIAGWYANCKHSVRAILPFIHRYGIDTGESLTPVDQFANFNEFFSRQLKPDARPIAMERDVAVAPADGRYYAIARLGEDDRLRIKGRCLRVAELLNDPQLAKKFTGGAALIIRLCPLDYHRFHFPCDCVPGAARPIRGRLHSVHSIALRRREVFSKNRRHLTRLVARCGEVVMVEVGATFVGTVRQTYIPHRHSRKGVEKGFFSFGGSTVILLFEPGRVVFWEDLRENSGIGMETYVHMGDRIAQYL